MCIFLQRYKMDHPEKYKCLNQYNYSLYPAIIDTFKRIKKKGFNDYRLFEKPYEGANAI